MVININDDRMIMEFLSGRYLGVPDGHAVYMNYPLTGLLAALYRILPNVDWYGYFLVAVMGICALLVAYRIAGTASERSKKWIYMLAAIGVCTFAMGREFFSITYTTVAAISGATAVFWYGTGKEHRSDVMITAILGVLTWCIRDELFLMIVPASGLIWLLKQLPKKEKLWKKFVLPSAVFGSVAVCMLINQAMYSSEEWMDYQSFNELRTEIFDYQDIYYFPNYEEYAEYYDRLDLTNEERRMLIYYNFILVEDEIGRREAIELFGKMIEYRDDYGVNEELLPLGQRIPAETKQFIRYTVTGAYGKLYSVALFGFLLLIGWLLYKKQWKPLIEAILFMGSGMAMIWVMEIRGRMPERVVYSLSLVLFVTMVLNYFWNRKSLLKCRVMKPFIFAGILGCTVWGIWNCASTVIGNQPLIENMKELETIQNYCNTKDENFYFVTGEVLDEYGGVIGAPIKTNEQLNYVSTGDWISYSPMEREKLTQKGIASAAEALLYDENMYLISVKDSANLKYVTDYLTLRNGSEVTAAEVESLTEEFAVYKFE